MTSKAIEQTKQWVEQVIIQHNFCPFAKAEVVNDRVRYLQCKSQDLLQATESIIKECLYLQDHTDCETSLLIFDDEYDDFYPFLDLVDCVDHAIDQAGLRDTFQIAHFHPQYLFDGEDISSPTHYTNRAPHPTLHIIRQASIERVMKGREDSDDIIERNLSKCHTLGSETLRETLMSIKRS